MGQSNETRYDKQMVCLSGHQITDRVEKEGPLPNHCPKCGLKTVIACPDCKAPIKGARYSGIMIHRERTVPTFCGKCGKPYPWAKEKPSITETAKEVAPMPPATKSNKVFIVHGHDEGMKQATARTLAKLGLEPIILHEMPNEGRTIIEKFVTFADVGYAVVLMSPDEKTFLKDADVRKAKPTLRARPNVILELGFFIGTLGRENVFVLRKPDVDIPSDYSGVIYHSYDGDTGRWPFDLVGELKARGYDVSADALYAKTA